jgi:ubiquinone/menaquinone biosynthesis C-methylase UbiE
MSLLQSLFMRAFGRPSGLLGRLGGLLMARMNRDCAAWTIGLLEVGPRDRVLEIGFGPGVAIRLLAELVPQGHVAGVDPSRVMMEQASARNRAAIKAGRVELRRGSVESLPFEDDSFDRALAVNAMQVWPDAAAGLNEVRRVLRRGGRLALGFTPYSGQRKEGLVETLGMAGFANARLVERDDAFCVVADKP